MKMKRYSVQLRKGLSRHEALKRGVRAAKKRGMKDFRAFWYERKTGKAVVI